MTCPNCGTEINDNRRFCGKCGTELNAAPSAPSTPPPPVAPPSSWGAPGTWGAPGNSAPPAAPAPPAAEPDPFAPPDLYAPPRTNGFAVASLVLSLVGWLPCGVGSVLAVIFGFIARDQIKRSQGREHGSGMATAGIVIGFVAIALWLLFFIIGLAHSGSNA